MIVAFVFLAGVTVGVLATTLYWATCDRSSVRHGLIDLTGMQRKDAA